MPIWRRAPHIPGWCGCWGGTAVFHEEDDHEQIVNAMEEATGVDLDGDGDVGVSHDVSRAFALD